MNPIWMYITETYSPEIIDQFTTIFQMFSNGDYTEHENDLNDLLMSTSLMSPDELQDNFYDIVRDHLAALIKTCSVILVDDEIPLGILIDMGLTLQQIEEMDEVAGVVDIISDKSMADIERFATIVELTTGRQVEESAQYIEDVSPMLFEAMMRLFENAGRLHDLDSYEKPEVDVKDIAAKLLTINTPSPHHFNVMNLVEDGLLVGMKYEFYNTYLAPFEHIDESEEEDLAKALTSMAVISSDAKASVVSFLEEVLLHTTFDELKRGRILSRIRELFIQSSSANPGTAHLSSGTKLNEQG